MTTNIKTVFLFFTLSCSTASMAGGPSVIAGPAGNTAVTYQDPAITVNVENGDLGALSNAVAITLMQEAFDLWTNINTSTVTLIIDQSELALDIDQDNADIYLPAVDQSDFNEDDGINPIVFDSDGQIIDQFFGTGQSDFIIGFAQSINTTTGSFFLEGFAVINGKNTTSNEKIKLLMAHEIGHFFGLDHSQVNIDNRETPPFCNSAAADYPLMYPIRCRDIASLHADDISAVSALYPTADINNSFGRLEGIFVDGDSKAILGANIWAENVTTGASYSIISDYLTQGNGFYKLLLPAGDYTLHANSINTEFVEASSIGPYATNIFDLSFTEPHPITAVTYQGDSEGSDEVITIVSNKKTTVNFSVTGDKFVIVNSADENDSIADLFGALSHLTLLMLAGLLMLGRLRLRG